jgi:hypothetical protein
MLWFRTEFYFELQYYGIWSAISWYVEFNLSSHDQLRKHVAEQGANLSLGEELQSWYEEYLMFEENCSPPENILKYIYCAIPYTGQF